MSEPTGDRKQHGSERASFVAQSSLVMQRPDERLAVLSRMDFAVLKDGEINGPKATRDLCFSVAITGVAGFIGLVATVDWHSALESHRIVPFIWAGMLAVLAISFFSVACFFQIQIKRAKNSSAYSILIKRLEEDFSRTDQANE